MTEQVEESHRDENDGNGDQFITQCFRKWNLVLRTFSRYFRNKVIKSACLRYYTFRDKSAYVHCGRTVVYYTYDPISKPGDAWYNSSTRWQLVEPVPKKFQA